MLACLSPIIKDSQALTVILGGVEQGREDCSVNQGPKNNDYVPIVRPPPEAS